MLPMGLSIHRESAESIGSSFTSRSVMVTFAARAAAGISSAIALVNKRVLLCIATGECC